MLVWAILPFAVDNLPESCSPGYDSIPDDLLQVGGAPENGILFPADTCTQFFATIDGVLAETRDQFGEIEAGNIEGIWIGQVEISEEDLLLALNDLSFNAASNSSLTGPNEKFPGIHAIVKQKLLFKG